KWGWLRNIVGSEQSDVHKDVSDEGGPEDFVDFDVTNGTDGFKAAVTGGILGFERASKVGIDTEILVVINPFGDFEVLVFFVFLSVEVEETAVEVHKLRFV